MTTLHTLPQLLDHLKTYGKGDGLKRQAMFEVEQALTDLGISRRHFLRTAAQSGFHATTVTSLGNWISCKYMPSAENVTFLIEALEALLMDQHRGELPSSLADQLQAASVTHHQELTLLYGQAQDPALATALLADTLNWITLSEFPRPHSSLTSTFIPITRQHGIQRLNLLREVQGHALDAKLFPANLPHALLVAAASIIVSHHLLEVGQPQRALEAADDGVYILEDLLTRAPHLRTEPMIGYTFRNWSQLEVLGLLFKSNCYRSLARQAASAGERATAIQLAEATLQSAALKIEHLPDNGAAYESGFLRDAAELLLEFSPSRIDEATKLAQESAQRNETMQQPDQPLLYYLGKITQAKSCILQGKFTDASAALTDAQAASIVAAQQGKIVPGPLHHLEYLRAEMMLAYAKAQAAGHRSRQRREEQTQWRATVLESRQLADTAGLVEEQQRILHSVMAAEPEFRKLVLSELRDQTNTPD